ncbi:hypothetical protein BGX29_008355 [Mortierella sp. GBA35]|nr:hypothetical protein BGX29_008355 [Mortierella sp. GBA35]
MVTTTLDPADYVVPENLDWLRRCSGVQLQHHPFPSGCSDFVAIHEVINRRRDSAFVHVHGVSLFKKQAFDMLSRYYSTKAFVKTSVQMVNWLKTPLCRRLHWQSLARLGFRDLHPTDLFRQFYEERCPAELTIKAIKQFEVWEPSRFRHHGLRILEIVMGYREDDSKHGGRGFPTIPESLPERGPAEPTTIEISVDEEEYMDIGRKPTTTHPQPAGCGVAQEATQPSDSEDQEYSQIIEIDETNNLIQPRFLLNSDDLLLDAYDSPDSEDDEDLERLVPESCARVCRHRTCAPTFHSDGDCEDDMGEDGSVYGDNEGPDQSDDLYDSSSDEWSSDEDEDDDDNDNMHPTTVLIQYSASSASDSTDVCQDEILEANIKRQSSTHQLGSTHGRRNSSVVMVMILTALLTRRGQRLRERTRLEQIHVDAIREHVEDEVDRPAIINKLKRSFPDKDFPKRNPLS